MIFARRHNLIQISLLLFGFGLFSASRARSESIFLIPYPKTIGVIPASTYDETGKRVGGATLRIERLESGHLTLQVRSGYEGGARQVVSAEFAPVESKGATMLRLLRERSQSFDPTGKPLVILQIDHQASTASCTSPGDPEESGDTSELPKHDNVANIPLSLLFAPLVQGDIDRLETRVFFCLGGARIMRFEARAADWRGSDRNEKSPMRIVFYEPHVNKLFNWAAKAMAPKIRFWFENSERGRYLAHRLPLYSNGPVVYVIREGVSPDAIIRSNPDE